MTIETKNCSVCNKSFESEDGLVSCPEHSFGECEELLPSKVSVQGFTDYLEDQFAQDNPELLDDDFGDAFSGYLSQVCSSDIVLDSRLYCKRMGETDIITPAFIADAFMRENFGK